MRKKSKGPVFTALEKKSIIGLSLILFFRMCGLFLVLPVFSVLALDLQHATPFLIGLAFGSYALSQAILQIPFGVWSDKYGRKRLITIGLVLYAAGSIIAALSDSIYWMIGARLVQGSGAISAAIFALIADLTRPEVRTRANAGLGASVGLSFAIAIFLAPFLGHWFGLHGIFWLTTALSLCGIICLHWLVPTPATIIHATDHPRIKISLVLKNPSLQIINWGAFVCGMGLSLMFFMIPLLLKQHGFLREDLWMVYLPMLILGGLAMVPAAIVSEVKNRFREVMLAGILILMVSTGTLLIGWSHPGTGWFIATLLIFFMGFNMFEPIFPSLVTRMTTPETKGTASGVYNFSQFIGHFSGATLGGLLYQSHPYVLASMLLLVEGVFFLVMLRFANPDRAEVLANEVPA
ncbi:MAG: MFS transporter [SAR324 cluster bacterium]|nr:MFS transporter [SAR324 cluster bacterium]